MFLPNMSAKTIGDRGSSFGATKVGGIPGMAPLKSAASPKMPKMGSTKSPGIKSMSSKFLNAPSNPKFANILKSIGKIKAPKVSAAAQKNVLKNSISRALTNSRASNPSLGSPMGGGLGGGLGMPMGSGMPPMGGGMPSAPAY